MKLFKKKSCHASENSNVPFDCASICSKAEKLAETYGVTLDYSKDSIKAAEKILDSFHSDKNNYSQAALENAAVFIGVYLGETLLRNSLSKYGYKWALKGKEPMLEKNDKFQMFPVTKAYKQICNGLEDSIVSFYSVSIAIAEGKIKTH